MLEKERSETLLKIIYCIEISQKLLGKLLYAHPELCLKQQIWIYWHEDNI